MGIWYDSQRERGVIFIGIVPEYTRRAVDRYNKENTVMKSFRFNKKTDADLLEFFSRCSNVQGFIKQAVREKIARMQKEG